MDNSTPKVILPRSEIVAPTDDVSYDLTADHALRYQQVLANRSGANAPMLTKRLREQQKPKRRLEIDYFRVRARLPDRTALELQLSVESTVHDLYECVKGSLVESASEVVSLYLPTPYQVLKDGPETLQDLKFSRKTLVLIHFEQSCSPPYLKPHLLEQAKTIEMAKEEEEEEHADKTSVEPQVQKPARTLSKTPKWMKLSKK